MPKNHKKSNSNNNKSTLLASDKSVNPFRAVIQEIDEKQNAQIYRHRLVHFVNQTGTVTGVNANFPLNGVASAQDWSSFAALYDEFRVLGLRIHYIPQNRYTTTISNALICLYDNDSTTITPSSNDQALSYANSAIHGSTDPFRYDAIFSFAKNAPPVWVDSASPSAQLGVAAIFTSNSFGSTIVFAQLGLEYVVEFRGRR